MGTRTFEENMIEFLSRAEKGQFSFRSVVIAIIVFVLLVLALGYAVDRDTAEQRARTTACKTGNTHMTYDGQ